MLEVDDPKLAIVFHMIAPMESLTPHLDSPLVEPMELLRKTAKEEMDQAKDQGISEGFLLKNLEPNGKLCIFFHIKYTKDVLRLDNNMTTVVKYNFWLHKIR